MMNSMRLVPQVGKTIRGAEAILQYGFAFEGPGASMRMECFPLTTMA